jgi:hypothetical protein
VWGCYAARVYLQAQRTGHQVHDRRAFEDAVALDGMRRLSEQALGWLTGFVLSEERLAEALADGKLHPMVERRQ